MSEQMDGQVIHREFAADLSASGDGRTLDLRVVPYNTPATVRDGHGEPYDEVWLPGVFDHQLNAANRVIVNVEHEQGISGMVGRGIELSSQDDGFHGSFRMLSTQDADKALELVREGTFGGVSLEAIPKKTMREDGFVKRVKAHLINVALCRTPAFEDARVLAVRQQQGDVTVDVPNYVGDPDELAAAISAEREPNSAVDEVLQRLGFESIVSRAVVRKAWDGSPSRFTDEEYQRSCLIDRGGDAPVKERCSLPVLEPNGDINTNALGSAAAALAGARGGVGGVTGGQKATAARKLVRYYRVAKLEIPPALRTLASR